MNITITSTLTKEQETKIRELEARAQLAEQLNNKLYLSGEINFDPDFPCFYLAEASGRLIAFLLIFIPDRAEAEISAITDPEFRQQGCFTRLLAAAREKLAEIGNSRVLVLYEPQSQSAEKCAEAMNITELDRIEYSMELTETSFEPSSCVLRFEEVNEGNSALFTRVSHIVYDEPESEGDRFTQAILNEDTRSGYIALLGDEPIGVFSIKYEEVAYIYGVGILEAYRSHGYGGMMISFAANTALKQRSRVTLDVDSNNPAALALYRHCGFTPFCELRYYVLPEKKQQ